MVEEAPRGLGLSLNFPDKTEGPNYLLFFTVREAAKKSSSTNGRAIKRGGWGCRAINEKRTFFETFVLLPFKNKNYFTLDNLSKYGNITLKFVCRYFYLLVTIFSKK